VIPYDMQAPVAVRCLWTNCYTLPLPLPLRGDAYLNERSVIFKEVHWRKRMTTDEEQVLRGVEER